MPLRYLNPSILFEGVGQDYIVFKTIPDKGKRFYLPKEAYDYAQKIADFTGRKEITKVVFEKNVAKFYIDPPFEEQSIAYEIISQFGPGKI